MEQTCVASYPSLLRSNCYIDCLSVEVIRMIFILLGEALVAEVVPAAYTNPTTLCDINRNSRMVGVMYRLRQQLGQVSTRWRNIIDNLVKSFETKHGRYLQVKSLRHNSYGCVCSEFAVNSRTPGEPATSPGMRLSAYGTPELFKVATHLELLIGNKQVMSQHQVGLRALSSAWDNLVCKVWRKLLWYTIAASALFGANHGFLYPQERMRSPYLQSLILVVKGKQNKRHLADILSSFELAAIKNLYVVQQCVIKPLETEASWTRSERNQEANAIDIVDTCRTFAELELLYVSPKVGQRYCAAGLGRLFRTFQKLNTVSVLCHIWTLFKVSPTPQLKHDNLRFITLQILTDIVPRTNSTLTYGEGSVFLTFSSRENFPKLEILRLEFVSPKKLVELWYNRNEKRLDMLKKEFTAQGIKLEIVMDWMAMADEEETRAEYESLGWRV